MSPTQHQAMCITSWDEALLQRCKKQIETLDLIITPIAPESPYGFSSFFITPCGSKAGWPPAKDHLKNIEAAKRIVESFSWEDGSNSIEFGVCVYGQHAG